MAVRTKDFLVISNITKCRTTSQHESRGILSEGTISVTKSKYHPSWTSNSLLFNFYFSTTMTKIAIWDSNTCLNTERRSGRDSQFELPTPRYFTSAISEGKLTWSGQSYIHNFLILYVHYQFYKNKAHIKWNYLNSTSTARILGFYMYFSKF